MPNTNLLILKATFDGVNHDAEKIQSQGADEYCDSAIVGFRHRLVATGLDVLITLPMAVGLFLFFFNTHHGLNYYLLSLLALFGFYSFITASLYGVTPGERIAKIKVIKSDGQALELGNQMLRNGLRFALGLPMLFALILTASGVPAEEYLAASVFEKSAYFMDALPAWIIPVYFLNLICSSVSLIVLHQSGGLLTLHDLIAKTKVVEEKYHLN